MMSDPNRVDPFAGDLDLSEFKPAAPKKPKIEAAIIREVSEANNFPSRAVSKPQKIKPAVQRRRRTGRNVQFNIKASAETVRRFVAISDAYGWPSGLTMEHAIGALEKELARESRPKGREPNSRG
jgi:hypothetical protein